MLDPNFYVVHPVQTNWGEMMRPLLPLVSGVFALLLSSAVTAQDRGVGQVDSGAEALSGPLYEESHALIIGASQYQHWEPLPGVVDDVKAVKDALIELDFNVLEVRDPTREELETTLFEFANEHGKNYESRLLIYFAGHGENIKNNNGLETGFLVPVDAPDSTQPAAFKSKALSEDKIREIVRDIRAKHVLLVFDSCFSGSLLGRSRSAVQPVMLENTASPVHQYLSSGRAREEVPDKSIFRTFFVRALKGAGDLNRDGFVTGSELFLYVKHNVVERSSETGRRQTPQFASLAVRTEDRGDLVFQLPPEQRVAVQRTAAVSAAIPPSANTVPSRDRAGHVGGGSNPFLLLMIAAQLALFGFLGYRIALSIMRTIRKEAAYRER